MIYRWLIFSSWLALVGAQGATVSGQVGLEDARAHGARAKLDLSGVVVWLKALDEAHLQPVAAKHAVMTQKNKTFTPHVLAVAAGTTVDFPNYDPIYHNAFSNYNGQLFDLGLYAPGTNRSVRFVRPGAVRIFCNIHASMSAVIVVVETPYFAVTGRDGRYEMRDVPPGDYELHVFHERATAGALEKLARRVTVAGEDVTLAPLSVSESGYLTIPHLNKYGEKYPPAESGVYAGSSR